MNISAEKSAKFSVTIVVFFALTACTEDSFVTDLSETFLNPHDTTTADIRFKTYQIPPSLGGHQTLYLGRKDGYVMPISFLKLGDLRQVADTSSAIDSAYFQITLDSAKADPTTDGIHLILGYFEADSSYSESTTNYTNIDWVPFDYPTVSSETFGDTSSHLTHVRFYVDSSLVTSWADTAGVEPLFVLKPQEDIQSLLAFYSSESGTNFPVLKIFFHPDTTATGDTTQAAPDTGMVIPLRDDLTIVQPPSLTPDNFDSTRSYAGVAAGLRVLIHANMDSLKIPSASVIVKAHLILPVDMAASSLSSTAGTEVQVFSLADTVDNWQWGEALEKDTYNHFVVSGTFSPRTTPVDSSFSINLTDAVQSMVSERVIDDTPITNLGFKLMVVSSSSIFDYIAFLTRSTGESSPYLEILYETP